MLGSDRAAMTVSSGSAHGPRPGRREVPVHRRRGRGCGSQRRPPVQRAKRVARRGQRGSSVRRSNSRWPFGHSGIFSPLRTATFAPHWAQWKAPVSRARSPVHAGIVASPVCVIGPPGVVGQSVSPGSPPGAGATRSGHVCPGPASSSSSPGARMGPAYPGSAASHVRPAAKPGPTTSGCVPWGGRSGIDRHPRHRLTSSAGSRAGAGPPTAGGSRRPPRGWCSARPPPIRPARRACVPRRCWARTGR